MVPALLIYGAQDKFVTLEEEQWMQEVSDKNNNKNFIIQIFVLFLLIFSVAFNVVDYVPWYSDFQFLLWNYFPVAFAVGSCKCNHL